MHTPQQVQIEKQKFLSTYIKCKENECKENELEYSLSGAIKAATRRNALYSKDANRNDIIKIWKKKLISLGQKYSKKIGLDEFLQDIIDLKLEMNQNFPESFNNKSLRNYEKGFRISHAQKSVSVYLKYLWCKGLIPTPPACPIDRRILKRTQSPDVCWCYVNDINTYKKHLCYVMEAKNSSVDFKDDDLPVWELIEFQKSI